MHPKEFKKEKVGTGRFTHLILENSEVIVGIGFDHDARLLNSLENDAYQSVVLYPGKAAIDLSQPESATKLGQKPLQFIVIDGTWPCAKKMMRLTTCLHALPRVSFRPGRTSEFEVKQQPRPECLATVESIHQVILDLNGLGFEKTDGMEENLMFVFRKTVQQQIEFAGDESRQRYRKNPLRPSAERTVSKRWNRHPLFFNDAPK